MWPKATLINIFLFCSYAASAVALPIHSQAILHDSAMLEARSGSISTQNYLPVPHVFGCGISQPTIKAANAGHGRRQRAQGLAKQIQTPQAKTHKASTHPAGRITRKGYSRTGIFIVKAMLYSAILCCVVEMSLTVTRWLQEPPLVTSSPSRSEQYIRLGQPSAEEDDDDDDEFNMPVL